MKLYTLVTTSTFIKMTLFHFRRQKHTNPSRDPQRNFPTKQFVVLIIAVEKVAINHASQVTMRVQRVSVSLLPWF